MSHIILSPVRDRDYTEAEVIADFDDNKDFIVEDFSDDSRGCLGNQRELIDCGYHSFEIRYNNKRKVMMLNR